MEKIFIVGGGPAGLLLASKLSERGFKVTLFEEHKMIGYPEHCTGIVRTNFFELLGYKKLNSLILAKYMGGQIIEEPCNKKFELFISQVKAVMIDRPNYEKTLTEIALSNGAQILLGKRAQIINHDGKAVVKTGIERFNGDLVIGARGPRANPNLKVLHGVQAKIKFERPIEENHVTVVFSHKIPKFFGWIAPYEQGNYAKVGVATLSSSVRQSLLHILSLIKDKYSIQGYFGGPVVVGGIGKNALYANYLPVGDEAGHVKPLTGGGLDLAAVAALKIVEDLKSDNDNFVCYKTWWRSVKRSLLFSEIVGNIFFGLPFQLRTAWINKLIEKPYVKKVLEMGDFDDHSKVLLTLF
ncbi:hypothetical protein B9Q02_04175 [Candidatus Marsarchaeota G1 archaeon BE_D]|jgi:Dehydrogenases (flavoproteins)|nr:MAG: hypothetical protein B9Q02_04175 [Candidatus Marsarchaeota G1 archaeon BE_D]